MKYISMWNIISTNILFKPLFFNSFTIIQFLNKFLNCYCQIAQVFDNIDNILHIQLKFRRSWLIISGQLFVWFSHTSSVTDRWCWWWCGVSSYSCKNNKQNKTAWIQEYYIKCTTKHYISFLCCYVSAYLMSLTYKNCLTFSFTHRCLGSLQKSPRFVLKLLKRMKTLKTEI